MKRTIGPFACFSFFFALLVRLVALGSGQALPACFFSAGLRRVRERAPAAVSVARGPPLPHLAPCGARSPLAAASVVAAAEDASEAARQRPLALPS